MTHFNTIADSPPRESKGPARIVAAAGITAILASAVTLLGWIANIHRLADWYGNNIVMLPNTTVSILLAGAGLVLLALRQQRSGAVLGLVAAGIGGATFCEHISGIDFHIDALLLIRDWGHQATMAPGRMGLPASASLAILGSMILCTTLGRAARRVAAVGGVLVVCIATLSITGYFFGADTLYSIPQFTAISLQTALLLFVLGFGLLAAVPEAEPMRSLQEKSSAGALVRRALPLIILIPLLLGVLCLKGEAAGLYDNRFEDSILVVALIALLSGLLFWATSAVRLHEAALISKELFNRSIVESSRDCIKTLDLDGVILWINEAGRKVLCIAGESDVIGRSWVSFWGSQDMPGARAAVEAALQGGTGNFIGYLPIKGVPRWWEVVITPIMSRDMKPEKLLAVSRDVTERRLAEETGLRLAAVVDSSEDAIVSKTLDGIIRSWNTSAQRMFGYTAEEIIGKPVALLFPPDRLKEEDVIISKLRRGERVEHFETIRLKKDGTPLDVSLAISPVKDSRGIIIGASKIARDITQQKKAAQALQDEARNLEILNETGKAIGSKLELENLVQTVTDAGTQLSGAKFGAFFYNVINEQGESFLLYTLSGAPRAAFEEFGLPRNTPIFNPTFRGEAPVRSADITKDPRYGTMLPHHGMPAGHLPVKSYLAAPVISRSGEVIGGLFFGHPETNVFTERAERLIVGIAAQAATAIDNARLYEARKKEIEQRKLAEQRMQLAKNEAERANRAKDEFLAIVSHELRTPLTAMLGWSHMLTQGNLDPATTVHAISVIERNVKMQTKLIEDLLDVSRVITGKLHLTMGSVDLAKALSGAIESIKPAADAKQIEVETSIDGGVKRITGDAARIQQVLWNLLSNAVKFTPQGGRVSIRVVQTESHVRITVEDNGNGIEPDFLPHMFERFRQSDSTTTRTYGGLGLGLAIVRHLVEQHGGVVSAHSDGIGKGATFTVELPIGSAAQNDLARADVPGAKLFSGKPLASLNVLVVEDENDSRDFLVTILAMAGASSIGVSSADEAFLEIDRRAPDVIVSDIGMPSKDGFTFMRELGARNGHTKIPVIALSAYAREEDRQRAVAAGFSMHLSKPVDPDELINRIAQLAGR